MHSLEAAIALLRKHYGKPAWPPSDDPFELVLLENVAYLASPARRREAFTQLKQSVGTSPRALLAATPEALESVGSRGILRATSAKKLRECARIAMTELDGDLDAAIAQGPKEARRALRLFPGIGEPGADRILLFAGREAHLAPESNGLRVLARLGLIREQRSYAKTYAAARTAEAGLPGRARTMQAAHLLLKQHGETLCRRGNPQCGRCPLVRGCAFAAGR